MNPNNPRPSAGFFVSRHLGLAICNIVLMKRFLPLLMLTGLLFGQENRLSQQEFTKMCSVMISSGELPEDFDIENRFQIHDKNKDGYVDAEELSEMMQNFFGEHDKSMIIKIAKASAKEDFNTGLIWSEVSIIAFFSGLYVYKKMENSLLASVIGILGPPATSYLIPVNIPGHRFHELQTKNEEYQIVYRTACEGVIRNQGLKYTIIGTSCSTVAFGVTAAVVFLLLMAAWPV